MLSVLLLWCGTMPQSEGKGIPSPPTVAFLRTGRDELGPQGGLAELSSAASRKAARDLAIAVVTQAGGRFEYDTGGAIIGVSLSGCQVTRRVSEQLQHFPDLQWIDLSHSSIRDDELSAIVGLQHVRKLQLHCTQLSDTGLLILRTMRSLEELEIQYTDVTDRGVKHLRVLPHLKVLNIGGTRITDKGMIYISQLHQLQDLFLSYTDVSDVGLRHVSRMNNLRLLYLWDTHITDRGLMYLTHSPNISVLGVGFTKISDAGVTRLRLVKPLLDIRW